MSWMHVYAQGFWHEPVLIAGDRDALTGLRAVIDAANYQTWETMPTPEFCPVDDGLAKALDRHQWKAIGNGQAPRCAATAWRLLTERAAIHQPMTEQN